MVEKKIAIIDFKNQDSGLKILFPDSGYFILEEEFDRSRINKKYNIHPIVHNKTVNIYDYITDITYDSLFIIAGLYGSLQIYNNKINPFFRILAHLGGALHPNGGTTRDQRTLFWGNHKLLNKSIDRIKSLSPDRIIMAHGKILDRDIASELDRIFAWVR